MTRKGNVAPLHALIFATLAFLPHAYLLLSSFCPQDVIEEIIQEEIVDEDDAHISTRVLKLESVDRKIKRLIRTNVGVKLTVTKLRALLHKIKKRRKRRERDERFRRFEEAQAVKIEGVS